MAAKASRKTVLITGCSEGGIGAALAREFHRRGLRVFATARDLDKARALEAEGLELLALDVCSTDSVRTAAARVAELTGGTLDVLVNNAGAGYQAAMTDCDMAAARRLFDVNVFAVVEVTKTFAPLLVAAKGRVVNIGSIAGKNPVPFQGIYNATKAAVQQISDNMRIEMAPLGVTVIHVVTGGIATDFVAHAEVSFPKESLYDPARDLLEGVVRGERSGEMLITPPKQYAASVVANALSRRPKIQQWKGNRSFVTLLLCIFMPHGGTDPFMSKMYSLDKVRARLQQRSQTS